MNKQEKDLIGLIGQSYYSQISARIPPKFVQTIYVNHTDWLLSKDDKELVSFYQELLNGGAPFSTVKIVGGIMVLSTHLNNLLQKLVDLSESQNTSSIVKGFDMHYRIIFCAAKYGIPDSNFFQLMGLKHFRNLIAHDFDSTMETGFHDVIYLMIDSQLLVVELTNKVRNLVSTRPQTALP